MKARGGIGLIALALLVLTIYPRPGETQPRPRVPVDVRVQPQTRAVTLRARNVPLSAVLAELQTQAGVEIVVPEMEDRNVTVTVTNQPITVVLERILPAGTRYWIRGGERDVDIPPEGTGDKPGRTARPRPDLPRKDAGVVPPIDPNAPRKSAPEDVPPRPVRITEAGVKAPPSLRGTSQSAGPKIGKRRVADEGEYAWLRFTMTPTEVTLQDALVLDGRLVPDTALLGEYIWALESGGQILAVGSFRDPLELHAFHPDPTRPHDAVTAASGDFTILLPESALEPRVLAASRLFIYDAGEFPPAPDLTPETFSRLRRALEPVHVIEGRELVRRLERR